MSQELLVAMESPPPALELVPEPIYIGTLMSKSPMSLDVSSENVFTLQIFISAFVPTLLYISFVPFFVEGLRAWGCWDFLGYTFSFLLEPKGLASTLPGTSSGFHHESKSPEVLAHLGLRRRAKMSQRQSREAFKC